MIISASSRSNCQTWRSRKPSASSTSPTRARNARTRESARSGATRRRDIETYTPRTLRVPADRQRLEAVDAVDRAVLGLAGEAQAGHARREERERLLQLGAGEIRSQAVMHAGAEGQRLAGGPARDVEGVGGPVAVARE